MSFENDAAAADACEGSIRRFTFAAYISCPPFRMNPSRACCANSSSSCWVPVSNRHLTGYLSRSVGLGDGDVHRRCPDTAIVGAFVERGDLPSVVGEAPGAADIGPTPMPGPILEAQLLADHVPLAVEEVCSVDSMLGVVANDLDPADRDVTDPPVRRVENEESPGGPFVHIARGDPHRRRPVARYRVALGDPLSDEDTETIVFRPACPRFRDPTRCNSGNRLLRLAGAHDRWSFPSRAAKLTAARPPLSSPRVSRRSTWPRVP